MSQLTMDYYDFDPVHHLLRARRSGHCYRLGDRVQVKLVKVDVVSRQIDFMLLSDQTGKAPAKSKRGRQRGRLSKLARASGLASKKNPKTEKPSRDFALWLSGLL